MLILRPVRRRQPYVGVPPINGTPTVVVSIPRPSLVVSVPVRRYAGSVLKTLPGRLHTTVSGRPLQLTVRSVQASPRRGSVTIGRVPAYGIAAVIPTVVRPIHVWMPTVGKRSGQALLSRVPRVGIGTLPVRVVRPTQVITSVSGKHSGSVSISRIPRLALYLVPSKVPRPTIPVRLSPIARRGSTVWTRVPVYGVTTIALPVTLNIVYFTKLGNRQWIKMLGDWAIEEQLGDRPWTTGIGLRPLMVQLGVRPRMKVLGNV